MNKKHAASLTFAIAVFLVLLLPFAGLAWNTTRDEEIGSTLAPLPSPIFESGEPNVKYLSELGTWFSDHFAYRSALIDADSSMRSVVGASTSSQVIRGTDGWLYYSGELPDYLGRNVISARGAFDIAHNARLIQDTVEQRGQTFFLTIAPNNSSAAEANMPAYLRKGSTKNLAVLTPALKDAQVNYVDITDAVTQTPGQEDLWLKHDSHWNNRGALRAATALAKQRDTDEALFDEDSASQTVGEIGDLESLESPGSTYREPNLDFGQYDIFTYTSVQDLSTTSALKSVDNTAEGDNEKSSHDLISTSSGTGNGSLFLFRDSFGNALLPFLASQYERATFSKLSPYDLSACQGYDMVGIEIAERHLTDLALTPPSMAAPSSDTLSTSDSTLIPGDLPDAAKTAATPSSTSVNAAMDGSYLKISGIVDEALMDDSSEIEVAVKRPNASRWQLLHPFYTIARGDSGQIASENGYSLYTDTSTVSNGNVEVKVFVQTKGSWREAAHQTVTVN